MKIFIYISIFISCIGSSSAQSKFKDITNNPHPPANPFEPAAGIPSMMCDSREAPAFIPQELKSISNSHPDVTSSKIASSGSLWIGLKSNQLWTSRTSVNEVMSQLIPESTFKGNWDMEWTEVSGSIDEKERAHIRVQQLLAGHPIHGQDMILHIEKGQLRDMNGFAWTAKTPAKLPAPVSEVDALQAAKDFLSQKGISFQTNSALSVVSIPEDKAHLVWLPLNGKLTLTYEVNLHPNLMDHWTINVDAVTLEIRKSYSQLCQLYPKHLYKDDNHHLGTGNFCPEEKHAEELPASLVVDGPTVINDQDLLGQSRPVNAYLVGSNFFMIDASRGGMFNADQSVMPNEPVGVLWTIDGQNGSPQKDNFEVVHVTNTNNNWSTLEVSAHFNAGESYEYFRQKFNRNSLNGDGGNVISIINVSDENGNGLDNAFWSGAAMFYGNGDVAFQALAKGLDVAGHEMSHGVIQNTANLEYMGQSGALNESFADVFGAMIDRADWQLGEDVVNTNFFPSGAMRDMSNPHNGGNGPNDNGWQPHHMNEYQNLPNTPEGDNGGVHVNSGITNRAFFLLASSIGKEKAEQIYYKALRDYLVKSSQFIDMRIAVEKAAADLHGAGSAEVNAVKSAFDTVGIGAGAGGDFEDDIDVNSGADFILATDEQESDLYFIPPSNVNQFVKMDVPAPLTRPSFTDDGSAAVYVDQANDMIVLSFDWSGGQLNYGWDYLETNPQGIWRNVVVSKDGTKIAFTTSQLANEINVFDFGTGQNEFYELFNPTTAEGILTGDVLYADAMEWDYSGEFVMYDALNRIESQFGDGIEYWDISFLRTWNNVTDAFGDGQIQKLYSSLPENVSIGNPSFAKNSPYIITFDFLEEYLDDFGQLQEDYWVIAANIESGLVSNVYNNTTVGYPSYSRLDNKILFTYYDINNDILLLGTINMQSGNKIVPVAGTDVVLINQAQKGVWFQTGDRDFTAVNDLEKFIEITVSPSPATDWLRIDWLDVNIGNAEFQMTDITGQIVKTGIIENGNSTDVGSLLPGVYSILLRNDDFQSRKLFVKK